MRKINAKNKAYMVALSIFVFIVLAIMIIFIFYRFKAMNIRYDIDAGSVVYNSDKELITLEDQSYAKKDLFGKYYIENEENNISLGKNAVIYNPKTRQIKMLGTYFEVKKNGEVNKLQDETIISSTAVGRVFKMSDRKYLAIGSKIATEDASLEAEDYLLIDIDKVGNGYLYNNAVNIKTFINLSLINEDFILNVNEEDLIIGDEIIDLSKINGSTNEYESTKKPSDDATGSGGAGGAGGGGTGDGTGGNESIYPETGGSGTGGAGGGTGAGGSSGSGAGGNGNGSGTGTGDGTGDGQGGTGNVETVIEEKYVSRKTTILGLDTTASEVSVNYIVYDPFGEYRSIYVNVYEGTNLVTKQNMELSLTKASISGLKPNTIYRFEFFYTYEDEEKNLQDVKFDTMITKTKSINASITLESTSENKVEYKVIVEGGYVLDSAKVVLYIDDKYIAASEIASASASSQGGYIGVIDFNATGEFATLKLIDCVYNGAYVDTDASYKYKM